MTWGLRGAGATGPARLALALVAVGGIVGAAVPGLAVELGGLQAVPSPGPPYVFRLPLITPPHGPATPATVTVRQPPDTLALVKQQTVEFRLRALADVELEVSYGGQTLNRLLPKGELQAARVRVDTAPASSASLLARAKERDRPSAEALPVAQVPLGAADRGLIERELAGIRQEIHSLVERVAPWEGLSPPGGDWVGGGVTDVLGLTLGGGLVVGVTSLTIGYLLRRRTLGRERQRRQALTLSSRRVRDRRAGAVPLLAARRGAPLARDPGGVGAGRPRATGAPDTEDTAAVSPVGPGPPARRRCSGTRGRAHPTMGAGLSAPAFSPGRTHRGPGAAAH